MSVRGLEQKGETREETRTIKRKNEKKCGLGVFGGTSDFNIFTDGTLLDYAFSEARNFVFRYFNKCLSFV